MSTTDAAPPPLYTHPVLQATIALCRVQAQARAGRGTAGTVGDYQRVLPVAEPAGPWAVQDVAIQHDGQESGVPLRYCVVYATEHEALAQAVHSNIDRLDEVLHRAHFLRDRRYGGGLGRRKKAHPFEASPTLAQALRMAADQEPHDA